MSDPPPRGAWTDQRIERLTGLVLRLGVSAAGLVILLGGAIHLARHGWDPVPDRRTFLREPPEFCSPLLIVGAALSGQGRAIIQFGLLLLIATPVARVAFCIFAFARQRDVVYVILPLVVLAVLLAGLFSGGGHCLP
jgi:uncharacterized membrane protein